MFLQSTLSTAASGLDAIERQIALVSQNVSNASTPNYVRQSLPLSSVVYGDTPGGVRAGVAQRSIDEGLQGQVFTAVGGESGSLATSAALAGIDELSGTPGSGQDLSSLVGSLRDSFSALQSDPSSVPQQADVVAKAGALADGLHAVGTGLVQARQTAQDALVQGAATANDALHTIGTLSDEIIVAKARGESTADLEDARDGQLRSLSELTGAHYSKQANGDLLVIAGNTVLPTRAASGPFSIAAGRISGDTPAASVPVLTVNGQPASRLGGTLGANLALRDTTVPALQTQVDGLATQLAQGFSAAGIPLFTDPAGAVPSATTAGFATTITVAAAAQFNPSFVRDGTGAAGAAGDSTKIQAVLSGVFTSDADGVQAQAGALVASYAQQATQAQSAATTSTAVRTGLETRLSADSGVSVDAELAHLVQLQAAYAANAKVITAVQSVWQDLLQVIP